MCVGESLEEELRGGELMKKNPFANVLQQCLPKLYIAKEHTL